MDQSVLVSVSVHGMGVRRTVSEKNTSKAPLWFLRQIKLPEVESRTHSMNISQTRCFTSSRKNFPTLSYLDKSSCLRWATKQYIPIGKSLSPFSIMLQRLRAVNNFGKVTQLSSLGLQSLCSSCLCYNNRWVRIHPSFFRISWSVLNLELSLIFPASSCIWKKSRVWPEWVT